MRESRAGQSSYLHTAVAPGRLPIFPRALTFVSRSRAFRARVVNTPAHIIVVLPTRKRFAPKFWERSKRIAFQRFNRYIDQSNRWLYQLAVLYFFTTYCTRYPFRTFINNINQLILLLILLLLVRYWVQIPRKITFRLIRGSVLFCSVQNLLFIKEILEPHRWIDFVIDI